MSLYLIGDLQGCHAPFQRLLDKIAFSPSRDTLYILGDLVNRGPESLEVLRSLSALGDAAQCLLGNHDLHLLAVWQGVRKPGRSDTVQGILEAQDSQALLDWLRHRAMALHRHGWLMVHAGVLPQWTATQTVALGSEVEQVLRGGNLKDFLQAMYGNTPTTGATACKGADRLRVIVNALTRLRFCTPEGVMDFSSTDGPGSAPAGTCRGLMFRAAPPSARRWRLAIGPHWPAGKNSVPALRNNTLPLDTGCVWGGCLTAARLGAAAGEFELISVQCEQAQKPGKPGKSA
jgi:bis(5'-nucleosyl)-tetraphosphatase (symmetrical)